MAPERRSEPSSPQMAALSQAITLCLKRKGMSRQEVANGCALNYEHINELARGQGNPTIETLVELCKGLGTTPGQLMTSMDELRGERAQG